MAKKLRIGFAETVDVTSWASSSGSPFSILQALQRNSDVEVELIGPLRSGWKWFYSLPKLKSRIANKYYEWRREEPCLRDFATQIEAQFREKKLDVVFSTSSIPGLRLRTSVPFVFWTDAVFDSIEGYYPVNWSSRTRRVGPIQEQEILRRADYSCYSSHWAADMAKRLTVPERVKVLPFGPNLRIEHEYSDVEGWIRERREARPRSCNLLFVGVDWLRKGGPVAIETARKLNDAGIPTTLRVIGCTPRELLPSFVEVIGFIDKRQSEGCDRLGEIYRNTDIFILPSRAEYSAIVLAEAAAFGLPALTCDTGGLADYVRNHKNGFRLPVTDDGTLFAEKAKVIFNSYETFAKKAYAEFENRLNWDTSVRCLVEILKSCVFAAKRNGKNVDETVGTA